MFQRVLIIGLGLMGGSLGLALKNRGIRVAGHDREPEVGAEALRLQAIDTLEPDGLPNLAEYQLVVLATPVRTIPGLLEQVAQRASPGTVLTDLGSTKSQMLNQLVGKLPASVEYIGGHPMTGSEIEGLAGADPHLYENAVWILARPEGSSQGHAELSALLETIGALVVPMDPEQHDRIVAMTSHLPFLAAVALVNALKARFPKPEEALALAAGGFLDTTRVAAGPTPVYRDICLTNRENLCDALNVLVAELTRMREALSREDEAELTGALSRARELRATLPRFRKGFPIPFFELVVKAQDRPGFLGELATLLGEKRINIKDFVLMHVREGEPGTILLAFRGEGDLERALATLSRAGFVAHRR